MAHGIPIITTTVGGLPDLLAKDAGILVPAGDSSALADAMHLLASDSMLRAQMGKAARERYLRLFAPDAVLPMLLTTYLRLVGAPPSSSLNGHHPWSVNDNGHGLAIENMAVASGLK